MATINFQSNDPGIVFSPAPCITQNSGFCLLSGSQSAIDTIVTGTDCTMRTYVNSGGSWTMTLDGVTSTLSIPQYDTWITLSLFADLPDEPHRLTLVAGGNHEYVETTTDQGTFQVTGANPALACPTGFSKDNQWAWTSDEVLPHISREGLEESFPGNYDLLHGICGGAALRFRASGNYIKVWAYNSAQTMYYGVDGGPLQGPVTLPDSRQFDWVTIATPSDTDIHEYNFYMAAHSQTDSQGLFTYAVMTVGGTGLDLTWTPPTRKVLALYGDSITEGSTDFVTRGMYSYLFDKNHSDVLKIANEAQSGSTVHSRGVSSVSAVTSITPTPTWCIVLYGTNDLGDGNSASVFQADYYNMMDDLTAGLPNTQFFVVGLIPRDGYDVSDYNTAIQAAIGDDGDGGGNSLTLDQKSQITFVDPTDWGLAGADGTDFSTNYIDGIHPNTLGNLILYNNLATYLGFVSLDLTPTIQAGAFQGTVSLTSTLYGGEGSLTASTTAGTLSTTSPSSGVPFSLTLPDSTHGDGYAVVTVNGPGSLVVSAMVRYGETDARSTLTPKIIFQVNLTPNALLNSITSDQMENFLYQESLKTTQIPGVGSVRNGDVFTLWGSEAVTVRDTFATGSNAILRVIG